MATDTSGRVAIQHAIGRTADATMAEYALLSNSERAGRLIVAAADIERSVVWGELDEADALIQLAAEATLWAEALQADGAR